MLTMLAPLNTQLRTPDELSPREREQMFALLSDHFENPPVTSSLSRPGGEAMRGDRRARDAGHRGFYHGHAADLRRNGPAADGLVFRRYDASP